MSKHPSPASQNKYDFNVSTHSSHIKLRAVHGGASTFIGQIFGKIIQLGSTVILARILRPDDYGLIAMVMVITGFAEICRDMGLSMATIQKEEITHEQVSSLFWINVGLSFLITIIVLSFSPIIVWFYQEPKLLWITVALSLGFIVGGLGAQHTALLRRDMRFQVVSIINFLSVVVGVLVGLLAAYFGAGVWALVFMPLASSLFVTVSVWVVCSWRPTLPKRGVGIGSMLAFGGNLTGFEVLNYFARNMDNILIGKFWGLGQLGLYNRSYQLLLLPIHQITAPIAAVAIPVLSRLQNEPERYRRFYTHAISLIAYMTMPLVVVMAALSDEIIEIILGSQWVDAGLIFKVLAFAAILQPVVRTNGWIYVSLGQTKRMLKWGFIAVPVIILSFIIGLPWGALGVAISYAICVVVFIAVPSMLFAFRYSPVKMENFFNAIICPLSVSLIVYLVIEFVGYYFNVRSAVWNVLWGCLSACVVFVLSYLVWPRLREEVKVLLKTIMLLKTKSV